ncbi:MAG: aquaporin [Actinobacteria bacterium]|nr:MAG: aquaporin [Actinomycetota bacterium]
MSASVRRWLAEALGTYVLVVIGSLAILSAAGGATGATVVAIALGFGLALLAGLYAFGEVSGGHFNPAVSLAMLLDGRTSITDFIGYVIAQVGGAVLASVTVLAASSDAAVESTATVLGSGVEAWEGFLMEGIATAIFLAVILKTTSSQSSRAPVFLGIAWTLVAIHLALIPFTGSSVNPARSIGPALVGGVGADLWLYIVAPLVGAAVGWALFKAVTTGSET